LFLILFTRTKKNIIFFKEISAYFYTLMGKSITLFVDMTLFVESSRKFKLRSDNNFNTIIFENTRI